MNWESLTSINQLAEIAEESKVKPVAIFKHSTRCSISATALDRLERNFSKIEEKGGLKMYYLDLLAHRDISNQIATEFGVEHESPQFLLFKDSKITYHESHYGIAADEIAEQL